MKVRINILLMLFVLLSSLLTAMLSPFLAFAQSSTALPANQTIVARYEALRALTSVRSQGDSDILVCQGSGGSASKIPLDEELTSDQFKDGSYSPIGYGDGVKGVKRNSEDFAVPATLFGNMQRMTCGRALSEYYETAYSGASKTEKRQKFLRDYYTTSGSAPYERKPNAETKLYNAVRSYMLSLISGRTDTFLLWRDRIISQGFNTCWKWGNSANKITDANRFVKENWVIENGGLKSVGYMAESAIESRYDDGVVNCDKIRDFIFDNPSNHYIMSFGTGDLQEEINGETEQVKLERTREVLATKNGDYVKFCVALAKAPTSFANLSLTKMIEAIANGLVSGEAIEDPSGAGEINLDSTSALSEVVSDTIKQCLKDSEIGDELTAIQDIQAPSAERTDGSDIEGEAVWDCEGIIPSGWQGKINPAEWAENAFDWFGCKVIQGVLIVADGLNSQVDTYLATDEETFTNDGIEASWRRFLTIANVLFVIAFLVIILSTVIGGK